MSPPSKPLRRDIMAALRNGTVPQRGIEHFAVGLARFEEAVDDELSRAGRGNGVFKAVRGEYGSGKTFFARWLEHRAQLQGFASAEVQISETETPLYQMQTIYRRAMESLRTKEWHRGGFRSLIDRWLLDLEEEVCARPGVDAHEGARVAELVGALLETRLASVSATQSQFAAVLRGYHRARVEDDQATAEGLLSWIMGQPNVAAAIKRRAGVKGEVDHAGAGGFLRGMLEVVRQTGRKGLVLVLDEVETVQRMRRDVRERSLNALRQLIDDLDRGQYPGLYVLVTGTRDFFEGPKGVRSLEPLAQRLYVDFNLPFESSKAVQVRLQPFTLDRLVEVGRAVRDLYAGKHPERIAAKVDDEVIAALARDTAGALGREVGIAPRMFLKKLVGGLLDMVDEHEGFDPAVHFRLELATAEMSAEEKRAAGVEVSVDDIELDLGHARSPDGEVSEDGP
ncbi:BREX system ATP-binding protein BrxD [Haliangium sp.]|uniref:BREX system ATP-binding protein BrxD n=1 Tax=Haliangium sp. TaxID=2663208 RepID=UPI003D0AD8C0